MPENLGFLTVIDQSPCGLTGGYLVLNRSGHPLEFHCTIPTFPEKIQKILYGDTLQPFLYGERIANTLLHRSKLPVFAVLTNLAPILPVQSLVSTPVIYVFDNCDQANHHEIPDELNESLKTFGIDNANIRTKATFSEEMPRVPCVPGFDTESWREIRIGNRMIAATERDETSWETLITEITERARTIDILEPFTRIRLAIEEARNAA